MFLVVLIMVAAGYGTKHALSQAHAKLVEHYRLHRDAMVANQVPRPGRSGRAGGGPTGTTRHVTAGITTAAAFSTLWHSLRLSALGFAVGWPDGWRHGKKRAHAWLGRQETPTVGPTPEPVDEPTPDSTVQTPAEARERPHAPDPIPDMPPAPADAVSEPTAGGARVIQFRQRPTPDNPSGPIKEVSVTAPTGEITSYDDVLAHLRQIAEFKSAELEDAQAQLDRAQLAASAHDLLAAGLANVKVAPESLAVIAPLRESATADIDAAQARVTACETAVSAARNAFEHFQQAYGNLVEAAAAAPAVPDAAFITSN